MSQPPSINPADVAGFISGYYNVPATHSAVTQLLQIVLPDVQQAAARDPRSWKSVAPAVIARYESMAKELGLGVSTEQRDLRTLRTANQTDAAYAAVAARIGIDSLRHYAEVQGRESEGGRLGGRGELPSSAAYARETSLTATTAATFVKELGISPAHAGFFVGGSPEMRDALRDAIKNGAAIADDKVKSMKDVGMVLGAIRSGKLKADDPRIPDSVKKVIEDMRKQGIDPEKADQKTIQKYLNDNPAKLQEIKQQNTVAIGKDAGLTDAHVKERTKGAEAAAAKAAVPPVKTTAIKPKEKASTLGG
jgi:hypothetical protein